MLDGWTQEVLARVRLYVLHDPAHELIVGLGNSTSRGSYKQGKIYANFLKQSF